MKVLFVAPWIPSRFRPRSLGILRLLSEEHDVAFIGLKAKSERVDDLHSLPLAKIETVPTSTASSIARLPKTMLRRESLQAGYTAEPLMWQSVSALAQAWQPDVAHFSVARSASWLSAVPNIRVVFDLDDIRSDYYDQLAGGRQGRIQSLVGRLEAPRMRRLEKRIATRSEVLLVSSPRDVATLGGKGHLVRSPHEPMTVLRRPQGETVLFVGRLSYSANLEALRWFVHRVLPQVAHAFPNVRLRVVGEGAPNSLRRMASKNVELVGRVEDLSQEYAQASVAVVPEAAGTGVQMKLIQALAVGVPCLTTSAAADRAGVADGREVLVADGPERWAEALQRMLSRPTDYAEVAARGQIWANSEYSASSIRTSLQLAYSALEQAGS